MAATSPTPGRRGRRIAAVLLATAAALVLVEVLLRVLVGAEYAPLYRIHETWLFEHIPGARSVKSFVTEKGRERVEFVVNADGFRGPELRPPGQAKRVLVYGDSFIAARATHFEDTYPERLAAELKSSLQADVEAINAGVVGYGPDQECLRMEAELPRLKPDLVIVAVLAENDFGDLLRNRLVELDAKGELVRRRAVLSQQTRDAYEAAQSGLLLPKVFSAMRAPGTAGLPPDGAAFVADELAHCNWDYKLAVIDKVDAAIFDSPDHPDMDVRVAPGGESARYKARLMSRTLALVRDVARRNRVPLVFLVIPSVLDVRRTDAMSVVDASRFPDYRPDNLTRAIASIAETIGVPFVDLFPAFSKADGAALYLPGDSHWNAAGQALAAKVTAKKIAEIGLLR
jgi:lysophospholipase L1-like esterase